MRVILVRERKLAHQLVWILSPVELEQASEPRGSLLNSSKETRLLNNFLAAKNSLQLLCTIQEFGMPLSLEGKLMESSVSPHLSRASRTALASECRFFSIGHDNVSSLKESGARNAIARFSLSREETLSHVLATCNPESRFVIEDLSDWTAVKNLLVFLLSLKAAIQQGKEPLLSGFEYERAYRFFEGYLRKRGITFNPYADSSLASAYDLFHDLATSLLRQGDYQLDFGFNGYHEGDLMASNLESQLWLSLLDYKSMYLGICVYCGLPFFVKGKSRKCYCSHNCLQMMRKLQA